MLGRALTSLSPWPPILQCLYCLGISWSATNNLSSRHLRQSSIFRDTGSSATNRILYSRSKSSKKHDALCIFACFHHFRRLNNHLLEQSRECCAIDSSC
ncbi:hypothetical protein EJ08DRAFT_500285 [Tothia fuscella]|uniref:Uncharacterized protein n=1 Tax=Tothia fuscella TaxID=1048955 RepID=A0A9P4NXQ1_9PEZI|nr:hypothetical protein EJ08DRAFT_500285 [Tothia fuscella]